MDTGDRWFKSNQPDRCECSLSGKALVRGTGGYKFESYHSPLNKMTNWRQRLKKTGWYSHIQEMGYRNEQEFLGFIDNLFAEQKEEFRKLVETRIKVLANVRKVNEIKTILLPPDIRIAVGELDDILKKLFAFLDEK